MLKKDYLIVLSLGLFLIISFCSNVNAVPSSSTLPKVPNIEQDEQILPDISVTSSKTTKTTEDTTIQQNKTKNLETKTQETSTKLILIITGIIIFCIILIIIALILLNKKRS